MKPIVLIPVWGLSLGAAFVAGKIVSSPQGEPSEALNSKSSIGTTSSSRSFDTGGSSSTNSKASAQARLSAAPMIKKGSTPQEMVQDIARYQDAIERNNALLALIDSLSPEDFQSVVSSFRELGLTDQRRSEYQILLTAWAKVDPTQALDYATENTGNRFARNTILATWSSTNPDAAIAWAEANHDNPERANPWLVGVIQGIAPNDLPKATGLMETLPRSEERGQVLSSLATQLASEDPEEAKDWATSIDDEGLRSSAYAFTADAIARNSPSEAAEWLAEVGDVDALNRASEDITNDWYRENPEEAIAWVNTLPPEAMSEAAEGIVGRVVREDPVEAAEYISNLATANPNANFDSSIRELVRGSARRDPELAAVWVGGLSNTNEQTNYYRQVLRQWRSQDSDAANAWIESNQANLPESLGGNNRGLTQ